MKLALCLEYPIGQFGGTEIIVQQLLSGLPERFEIVLVSPDSAASLKQSGFAGRVTRHLHWDPAAVSAATSARLARDLRETGVHLAHFHFGGNYGWANRFPGRCPIIALQRFGVPCVSNNNGFFSGFDGYCGAQRSLLIKLGYFPFAWFAKLQQLAKVRAEVCVSRNDYLSVRRWYFPMRSRFRLIYPSRILERTADTAEPRAKTILCVGTIGPRKGQAVLAEAFCRLASQHPEWSLVLVGRNGDAKIVQRIHELVAEHRLADRVRHLENCSGAEVDQWMKSSAIFAMPSVAEGLGMSLMEALYQGCACVGSRVGGIPDLIQHDDNGLLVEPANVAQLAEALHQLMTDGALRARLTVRGTKSILEKDMTAERMVANYVALYDHILPAAAA